MKDWLKPTWRDIVVVVYAVVLTVVLEGDSPGDAYVDWRYWVLVLASFGLYEAAKVIR